MYKAAVIEILIASPSDVIKERDLIRNIIDEWNVIHSRNRKAVLKHIGWEKNVYSSLEGKEPQAIINEQILNNIDLLVGIFWTRIGTPTNNFESGTIEEIKKHMQKNKPVMVYFSDAPVVPSSIDQEQYEKLIDFKNWCKGNGIINTFNSIDDINNIFRNQLGIIMNENQYILNLIGNNTDEDISLNQNRKDILISEEAKQLLKEISLDSSGHLTALLTLGGYSVHTNGKDISAGRYEAREVARINAIIEELEKFDFIRPSSHERDLFTITAKGYNLADKIEYQE